MAKKRKALKIVGIVVLALLVVLVAAFFFLGSIVKAAVEGLGPSIAGVELKIGSLDIQPFRGRVELRNFIVGNPQGYSTPYAMDVGLVNVEVVPSSLFASKLQIRELAIQNVKINYEQGLTSSNLLDINSNLQRLAPQEDTANQTQTSTNQDAASKKLQVDLIDISDITVAISIKGTKSGAPIPIPPVLIRDLGTGPDGATPSEISIAILAGLINGIAQNSGLSLKNIETGTINTLNNTENTATDAAKSAIDSLKKLF